MNEFCFQKNGRCWRLECARVPFLRSVQVTVDIRRKDGDRARRKCTETTLENTVVLFVLLFSFSPTKLETNTRHVEHGECKPVQTHNSEKWRRSCEDIYCALRYRFSSLGYDAIKSQIYWTSPGLAWPSLLGQPLHQSQTHIDMPTMTTGSILFYSKVLHGDVEESQRYDQSVVRFYDASWQGCESHGHAATSLTITSCFPCLKTSPLLSTNIASPITSHLISRIHGI